MNRLCKFLWPLWLLVGFSISDCCHFLVPVWVSIFLRSYFNSGCTHLLSLSLVLSSHKPVHYKFSFVLFQSSKRRKGLWIIIIPRNKGSDKNRPRLNLDLIVANNGWAKGVRGFVLEKYQERNKDVIPNNDWQVVSMEKSRCFIFAELW